ncbi:MAG: hypothetical protein NZ653_03635, partial [Anaerolineae bacterium]|nr:hypothetical protein [Anaerolineae bacterium]
MGKEPISYQFALKIFPWYNTFGAEAGSSLKGGSDVKNKKIYVLYLLLIAALLVGLAPYAYASSPEPQKPLPEKVQTASDPSLAKLAPDLRGPARNPTGRSILISVLMTRDVNLSGLMKRVVYSRPLNGIRWATGEILDTNLKKLAGIPGVISVISTESYKPVDVPGEEDFKPARIKLTKKEIGEILRKGGKKLLRQKLQEIRPQRAPLPKPSFPGKEKIGPSAGPGARIEPLSVKVKEIHGASAAHTKG